MAANISAIEVRYRLRTLTSVEVDDTTLASDAYIGAGDAWLTQILLNSSLDTFVNLSETKQTLCKAAEMAWVSAKIISAAPLRGSDAGPIKIKPISAEDQKVMVDVLRKEWTNYLTLVGASETAGFYEFDVAGGADYMPDSEDGTNIDYVSDDVFSTWSRDVND